MRATPSGPGPSLEGQWETGAWRQQPGRGGLGGPPSSPDGVGAPRSLHFRLSESRRKI